ECTRVLQHFLVRLHLDEELSDFGLDAAVAADIQFPSRIDADHADILDTGLGAVARTAGYRQRGLVRRMHQRELTLQLLPHARRILRAEAAPFGTDASLHRAQALRVTEAGRHAEVVPDVAQV